MDDRNQPFIETQLSQREVVVGQPAPPTRITDAFPPFSQPNNPQYNPQYYPNPQNTYQGPPQPLYQPQMNNYLGPGAQYGTVSGQNYQYQQMGPPPPSSPQVVIVQNPQQPRVVAQPQVLVQAQIGQAGCPTCGFTGVVTKRVVSPRAHIWCFILFCFTLIFFWIPYVMDSCYNTQIVCAKCGTLRSQIINV